VLGRPGRPCYRVRWEADVESVFVPSEGDRITHRCPHEGTRAG